MFILHTDRNRLTVRQREPAASGSVGACTVRFRSPPGWDGVERTAAFKMGSTRCGVPPGGPGTCMMP